MNTKIKWDVRLPDKEAPAVMFNDNGLWFTYLKAVSLDRMKTLIRELAQVSAIESVKIRPIMEAAPEGADYTFSTARKQSCPLEISITPFQDDPMDYALRDMPHGEFSSLIGNPSKLAVDYWSLAYRFKDSYKLIVHWIDGQRERELSVATLMKLTERFQDGMLGGEMAQIDEETGTRHDLTWVMFPLGVLFGPSEAMPDRYSATIY